jgi:purine-binding chemotaxis protein CheW
VVIVLNVHRRVLGVVVDSVCDVLELSSEQIKAAPALNASVNAGFITGIGTARNGEVERMLILVDIEALMDSADMGLVQPRG